MESVGESESAVDDVNNRDIEDTIRERLDSLDIQYHEIEDGVFGLKDKYILTGDAKWTVDNESSVEQTVILVTDEMLGGALRKQLSSIQTTDARVRGDIDDVCDEYRSMLIKLHPDNGGDRDEFMKLMEEYKEICR